MPDPDLATASASPTPPKRKCTECEQRGSELLQQVCKVLDPNKVDCAELSAKFERGELTMEQYASEIFNLLATAPPEEVERVRAALGKFAPKKA